MDYGNITRPMKGEAVKDNDMSTIDYPVLASPKLDGIRCVRPYGREPMTQTFKPVPNKYVRNILLRIMPEGFDGELLIPGATFNEIQSCIMSFKGSPEFELHAFDFVRESLLEPFSDRIKECEAMVAALDSEYVKYVKHTYIKNIEELKEFEFSCLAQGYEGVVIRKPSGRYKCGKSTVNEGLLLKLKRFYDDEGVIVGFLPLLHNNNPKVINELGLSKRSSCKENMIEMDTLGKFILDWNGHELRVGGGEGLTKELRKKYWDNRSSLIGKKLTFKYQKYGMKNLPREPIFKGIRED